MPQETDKSQIASPAANDAVIAIDTSDGAQKKLLLSALATYLGTGGISASDLLTLLLTVDGSGSGLDADLIDGVSLAGLVQTARTLTAGAGLTGGGDLSADRTFNVAAADSSITVNADSIQVGFGSPVNVGTANSDGAASTAARSNHVHGPGPLISDADGDTKVEVERTADDDVIRFMAGGTDILSTYKEHFQSSTTNGTAATVLGHTSGDATTPTVHFASTKDAKTATFDVIATASASSVVAVADSITLTGPVSVSSTVDGRDLSVDGAKLDGIESGATADQSAAEILAALLTVDGSGSGLDADLLDGQSSAYYLNTSSSGQEKSGTLILNASLFVDALAAANANVHLRDDSDVQQATLYWQRSDDTARWRRWDAAGTGAEGEVVMGATSLKFNSVELCKESRTLTGGEGISALGDLSADRTVSLALSELTEIGAALVDADWVAGIDESAASANRKMLLSRFWTYIGAKLTGLSEIGGALADGDIISFLQDVSDSNNAKTFTASRIYDYIIAKTPIATGTWTPSYTSLTNCSAVTLQGASYLRVGDRVVYIRDENVTLSSATVTKAFRASLPIASAFTQIYHLSGWCGAQNTAASAGVNYAETGSDTMVSQWNDTGSSGTRNLISMGMYRVL
jgi:hypothetical protein